MAFTGRVFVMAEPFFVASLVSTPGVDRSEACEISRSPLSHKGCFWVAGRDVTALICNIPGSFLTVHRLPLWSETL